MTVAGGYFDDSSMLRRIHRERALALSGPRALLMQAAHPLAVAGLLAHTAALDEPYDRLARTAEVMGTIGFGTRADADRVTRRVRAMHRQRERPPGRSPPGRTRRAPPTAPTTRSCSCGSCSRSWTPASWCTATTWAASRARRRRPTGRTTSVVGRLFGLRKSDMPRTLADLDDYRRRDARRATASTSPRGRASGLGRSSSSRRCRCYAQPLVETVNFITIALLPDRIRDGVRLRGAAAGVRAQGAGARGRRVRQARRWCRSCRSGCGWCPPRAPLRHA